MKRNKSVCDGTAVDEYGIVGNKKTSVHDNPWTDVFSSTYRKVR